MADEEKAGAEKLSGLDMLMIGMAVQLITEARHEQAEIDRAREAEIARLRAQDEARAKPYKCPKCNGRFTTSDARNQCFKLHA